MLLRGDLEAAPGTVLGREGVSYATGRCLEAGAAVRVEYPPDRPDRSRVQGMRRAWFGPDILFIPTETTGRKLVSVRSSVPEPALHEARERIVYAPERPEEAAAWDLLPAVQLDERGELAPSGFASALLVLLPPATAVAAHLVALGLGGP